MPRTCLACASPQRSAIDKALVAGEPLRNIAKRVSISAAGLLRHKAHASRAIAKAAERREERLGDDVLEEMRRVQRKAWELLAKAEANGDTRGSIVALREVRECLESLGGMLAAAEVTAPPVAVRMGARSLAELGAMILRERNDAKLNAAISADNLTDDQLAEIIAGEKHSPSV